MLAQKGAPPRSRQAGDQGSRWPPWCACAGRAPHAKRTFSVAWPVLCLLLTLAITSSVSYKLHTLARAQDDEKILAVLLRVSVPLGVAGGADVVPPMSTLVQPQLDEVLANMEFTDSILWARYVPAANRSAWEASTGLTIRDVGASFSRMADAPVGDSRTAYLPVTTYVQQQALTSNVYALQASLPGLNLLSEPLLAAAFDSAVAYGVDVCTPPMVTVHNALGAFIVSPVYAATSVNPMYLAPEERRALLVGAFIQQVSFATLIGDPLFATHSLRFLLRSPSPLLRSSAHAPPPSLHGFEDVTFALVRDTSSSLNTGDELVSACARAATQTQVDNTDIVYSTRGVLVDARLSVQNVSIAQLMSGNQVCSEPYGTLSTLSAACTAESRTLARSTVSTTVPFIDRTLRVVLAADASLLATYRAPDITHMLVIMLSVSAALAVVAAGAASVLRWRTAHRSSARAAAAAKVAARKAHALVLQHVPHTMGNPLQILCSMLEFAQDEIDSVSEHVQEKTWLEQDVTVMRTVAQQMAATLRSLANPSAALRDELPVVLDACDMRSVLRDLMQQYRALSRVPILLEMAPNFPASVALDAVRVGQILSNVLALACQHTTRGSIVVRVWTAATRAAERASAAQQPASPCADGASSASNSGSTESSDGRRGRRVQRGNEAIIIHVCDTGAARIEERQLLPQAVRMDPIALRSPFPTSAAAATVVTVRSDATFVHSPPTLREERTGHSQPTSAALSLATARRRASQSSAASGSGGVYNSCAQHTSLSASHGATYRAAGFDHASSVDPHSIGVHMIPNERAPSSPAAAAPLSVSQRNAGEWVFGGGMQAFLEDVPCAGSRDAARIMEAARQELLKAGMSQVGTECCNKLTRRLGGRCGFMPRAALHEPVAAASVRRAHATAASEHAAIPLQRDPFTVEASSSGGVTNPLAADTPTSHTARSKSGRGSARGDDGVVFWLHLPLVPLPSAGGAALSPPPTHAHARAQAPRRDSIVEAVAPHVAVECEAARGDAQPPLAAPAAGPAHLHVCAAPALGARDAVSWQPQENAPRHSSIFGSGCAVSRESDDMSRCGVVHTPSVTSSAPIAPGGSPFTASAARVLLAPADRAGSTPAVAAAAAAAAQTVRAPPARLPLVPILNLRLLQADARATSHGGSRTSTPAALAPAPSSQPPAVEVSSALEREVRHVSGGGAAPVASNPAAAEGTLKSVLTYGKRSSQNVLSDTPLTDLALLTRSSMHALLYSTQSARSGAEPGLSSPSVSASGTGVNTAPTPALEYKTAFSTAGGTTRVNSVPLMLSATTQSLPSHRVGTDERMLPSASLGAATSPAPPFAMEGAAYARAGAPVQPNFVHPLLTANEALYPPLSGLSAAAADSDDAVDGHSYMHASLSAPRSATVIGGSTHSVPHAPYSLVPHSASAMSVSPTRLVYTADLRMRAPQMDQSLEIGAIASPASVWTLVQPLSVASAAALPLPSQLVALPCDASGAGLREVAAKRSVVSQPSDSDSVYSYASGAMDDGAAAHDFVSRVSLVDTALARDGTPDVTSVTGAADRRGVPAAFALDCAAAVAAGATTATAAAAAAPARFTQPPFVTAGDNAPAQLAAGGSVSTRSRPRRTHLHIDVGGASRSSSSSARSDAGFTPDADKQCSHTWPPGNSLHLVGDDDASSRASGTPGSDARARSVHTPSTASSEHTTTPVAPLRLHVLIVEDEDLIRKILCRILTKLGCTYVAVEDGVHVLPLLRAPGNHFDAILMDVVMPYMRGDECLAQLRQAGFLLPVIMATSNASNVDVERYLKAGASGVMPKPFSIADARRVLTAVAAPVGSDFTA